MTTARSRKSVLEAKERIKKILQLLKKEYPHPRIALNYSNPLELLIAVLLSAQCTDARVNEVTKSLFKKYRTAKDYAEARQEELEQDIRSTGFYRNKAKNIIACCKALVERHNGKVPDSMEQLTKLAGVGRKTANCVLGGAYGICSGVIVDTHVKRLANRLGLSRHDDPEKIELDLMQIVPQPEWYDFSNRLIWHGRKVCHARKPKCPECILQPHCPSAEEYLRKYW
jgi:endonuclease-3